MASRKDNRGRALGKNEYQRENGTYTYLYRDLMGNRKAIYAPDLATLREKEKKTLPAPLRNHKQISSLVSRAYLRL